MVQSSFLRETTHICYPLPGVSVIYKWYRRRVADLRLRHIDELSITGIRRCPGVDVFVLLLLGDPFWWQREARTGNLSRELPGFRDGSRANGAPTVLLPCQGETVSSTSAGYAGAFTRRTLTVSCKWTLSSLGHRLTSIRARWTFPSWWPSWPIFAILPRFSLRAGQSLGSCIPIFKRTDKIPGIAGAPFSPGSPLAPGKPGEPSGPFGPGVPMSCTAS